MSARPLVSLARFFAFVLLAHSIFASLSHAQNAGAMQNPAANALTFKVQAAAERLEMTVNTSRIMEMPHKVPRIFVANPDLVRATPLSPNQVQLSALKPGVTQVNIWDEADRISTVDLIVYGDARELEMLLKAEFPDAQLKLRALASSVYISGFVPKAEQVGQIVRMAEDFYPKVVNNIAVGGVQQILLNVKVMEVSRTKLRAMGVDWSSINSNFFLTQRSGNLISGLDDQTNLPLVLAPGASDTVRFGVLRGGDQYYGFLDMLRQNDLAKLLAEPKLTTVSGRPAVFNVGGQVPIPIAQSLGTTTVLFKDFGTQIDFVPVALGNGNIRLEVRPDITEIDPSLRDATTGVPGFRRRYADTAVELRAGQTMAIAGLIYYRTDASVRGVPWFSDLPWVGSAFRRTTEKQNEVELVITVTPEFVEAMDPEQVPECGPGQFTGNPTDTELYGRGYIEVPKCAPGAKSGNAVGESHQSGGSYSEQASGAPVYSSASLPRGPAVQQRPVQSAVPSSPPPQYSQPRSSPPSATQNFASQYPASTTPAAPRNTPTQGTSGRSAVPVSSGKSMATPTGGPYGRTGAGGTSGTSAGGEPKLIGPLGYDPLR